MLCYLRCTSRYDVRPPRSSDLSFLSSLLSWPPPRTRVSRDLSLFIKVRGRYPALGHSLSWVITFFFKLEENNHFSLYAYCFIFKSDLLNSNFVEKIHILYCFSWKVTFSMNKVNFWIFGLITTKRLNIDSFTNENWNKFKCHRSKVSRRKEKKFVVNNVL